VIGLGPLAETQKPHRPIASLSGGEWTRVAMARLLIEAPDLCCSAGLSRPILSARKISALATITCAIQMRHAASNPSSRGKITHDGAHITASSTIVANTVNTSAYPM
jgi:hypothetical protein